MIRLVPASLLLLALGSCAPRVPPTVAEPTGAPPPIVAHGGSGLEVHWWIADDTDNAVARALAQHSEGAWPEDESLRAAWALNGIAALRAPAPALEALRRALPPVGLNQKQWHAWLPRWTEVFAGRRAGGPAPLVINGQRRSLPSGVLRAIVRCWPSFDEADPGAPTTVARIELAFQVRTPEVPGARATLTEPTMSPAEREGEVFRPLTLTASLHEGFIYLITGAAPGASPAPASTGTASPPPPPPPPSPPPP
ncbi:MAG TPA: hypothetical protein DEB06_05725, partial [Phycisphaerales bacterium]|nr:hypothetical protein [Phycisphaerales bacterium]